MSAFIRNLVGAKTDSVVDAAIEALVRWNPKSATEAELRTMEEHLDQLGLQVAQARAAYSTEKKEADTIVALSQQRMSAAEQLNQRLVAETNPQAKQALEKSLGTLVAMLESMSPDIDREKQDAEDAEGFLRTMQDAYHEAGQKLHNARKELQRAQRDMERASSQREIAEQRADAARQAAGLVSATSGLTVALRAMQDTAQRNLVQAEVANAKAMLLRPSKPEQDDPNIAAAMTAVSGKPVPSANLGDRLQRLRQLRS